MNQIKANFTDDKFSRGVEKIYPSKESLDDFLQAGHKLDIYFGIDPTGPVLHIGHGSVLLKLKELQDDGHNIIILFGDFTATIGDPTGKLAPRVKLTEDKIKANYKNYKNQIGQILDLNKVTFKFNSEWLSKMTLTEVIDLASEFTTAQILERDMFQERIKKGEPIFVHEFLYPLMQGYDSVEMAVNAEIGANDQTFNMLCGRTMLKRRNKEKFVIATKLLTDGSGKKMGKTEGNMVTLEDSPADMYGKVMSWSDDMMPLGFEICTRISVLTVKDILAGNPKDAKMILAKEIVSIFIGSKQAEEAEQDFVKKFSHKEIPDKIEEIKVKEGDLLKNILVDHKIIASKLEFKRLIESGAISNIETKTKITDLNQKIEGDILLKIGKKSFIKLVL